MSAQPFRDNSLIAVLLVALPRRLEFAPRRAEPRVDGVDVDPEHLAISGAVSCSSSASTNTARFASSRSLSTHRAAAQRLGLHCLLMRPGPAVDDLEVERLQGALAKLAPAVIARDANHDAKEPGGYLRARLEVLQAAVHHHEDVLHGVIEALLADAEALQATPREVDVIVVKRVEGESFAGSGLPLPAMGFGWAGGEVREAR